jgi:hypothetical protein
MLYIDVAKVDRDIAHVILAIHVYFKCMFQMFHLFQTYVVFYVDVAKVDVDVEYTYMLQACVFKCFQVFHTYVCKCFIYMLHMFVMVFKCFEAFGAFARVSYACFKHFICLSLYITIVCMRIFRK